MTVHLLIATIPPRRASVSRLLAEVAKQSRQPDRIILCLDGYGTAPAPECALPVTEYRTDTLSGPGARWRVAADLAPDDALINLDDDYMIGGAPNLLAGLISAIEHSKGAAAAMGLGIDGKPALPGLHSRGHLLYAAGCGLAVRAKHLEGLQAFRAEIQASGGPNMLGPCGDDDALVSAHLWRRKIPILHAATGIIHTAPNMRASSQTAARAKQDLNAQKRMLKKITGWPFPVR